jgi:phosphopantothenoylcysteine decarboxylase/phosphopantothenate--cysteine ligase
MLRTLREKHIVLGVAGSIAAYKALYLTRLLVEAKARVSPIVTRAAARFVGPLSFSVLSGERAITDLWSAAEAGEVGHVELAHRADVLLLAPASADLLARVAEGRADDPLCAVALATQAPWVVAPAMESGMWEHPSTQAHVATLQKRGATFVWPENGDLASGRAGIGRLAEPANIVDVVASVLSPQDLTGERVLVTAGPTREPFDPARFISNPSSGKMGYAIAKAARMRGAEVRLITGPSQHTPPAGMLIERVETTIEMLHACQRHVDWSTSLIMAAAPADFTPREVSKHKVKKTDADQTITLTRTPDILMTLKARRDGRIVVAFAAESQDVLGYAREKLARKDVDMVVANDITEPGAGFASDTNRVDLLDRSGQHTSLPSLDKEDVAWAILDHVARLKRAKAG